MKKMIITVLALMLSLSACGKQDAARESTVPPTTEIVVETSVETTVPVVEETAPQGTIPEITEEVTEPTVEVPTEPKGVEGTVTARSLNVREEPSINAKRVAQLPRGTNVLIYEEQLVAGVTWGRIDEGWVSMDFIRKGDTHIEIPFEQKPAESTLTEPKPTEPESTEPKPTEPKPTESEPPAPTQCQHQWNAIQNIPAEYEYHYYVVCSCGARFPDAAAWRVHSDSFSGEELLNHAGYASGSDRTMISPAKVLDQCALCSATRERVIG